MENNSLSFNEMVKCSLNRMEEGLISKAAVHESIVKEAACTVIDILSEERPVKSPANLLQMLHDNFSIAFVIHNGTVTDVKFETELDKAAIIL